MSVLRAGLLGLGMMGRHHARVLRSLEGVELVAVADPGGDPHGVAGGLDLLPDVEKLVGEGLDMCVVAVPTGFHEEVGLVLADAGVHTLVEKPLASSVAGAEKLATAYEAAGLVGCVGHIERYNPALQNLRARLAQGELGEIHQVITRRQGPFPNRIADVGVVKDLATHDIDLVLWLGGGIDSIHAHMAKKLGVHEDLVEAVGRLSDGTVVSISVNWLTPTKQRTVTVLGERGALHADMLTADLTFYANADIPTEWDDMARLKGVSEGDMIRYTLRKREPLQVELETFRDTVLARLTDDAPVSLDDGVEVLRIADMILDEGRCDS